MRLAWLLILTGLLPLLTGAQRHPERNQSASAPFPEPFSAVALISFDSQPPLQAHIYIDHGRQRINFDSPNPGMAGAYQLILIPEKKVYLVLPESHRCVPSDLSQLPGAAQQAIGAEIGRAPVTHLRQLGDAVVDGQRCRVEEWQTTRDGHTVTVRMWTTRDARRIPVQMQISSPGSPAMTVHYAGVQTGPPPASLFVVPSACREFPSR